MSRRPVFVFVALAAALVGMQVAAAVPSEPFFHGDETRHVMTGVFVRDALRDSGFLHPRAYAESYYAQYPALGLIVWPPGFYAVEGLAMSVFGPTFEVARGVVLGYLVLAAAYLFALARRTHGLAVAVAAVLLYGISRDVFVHSRAVMLETPLTACVLGAVFHLERYLAEARRRDLVLVGIWTVAAGLHRYDALLLAPLFVLRLLFAGRLRLLLTRDVILAGLVSVLLLAPVYYLAVAHVGSTAQSLPEDESKSWWRKIVYYPGEVWYQLGHAAAVAAGVGLVRTYSKDRWASAAPYWSIIAAVYLTLTPLGEQSESRHVIPWVPALCVFAAEALTSPGRTGRARLAVGLTVAVVAHSAYWTLATPPPFVRGYRPAAEYILANSDGPCVVLFDGLLDGTFIFAVRQADHDRRVWVLRGDKLLYAVRSAPDAGYVEWAKDEAAVLRVVTEADPDYVVIEDPPAKYTLPAAKALRVMLTKNQDQFERVEVFPVETRALVWLEGRKLVIYRNKWRNPTKPRDVRMKMIWQGTEMNVPVSGGK